MPDVSVIDPYAMAEKRIDMDEQKVRDEFAFRRAVTMRARSYATGERRLGFDLRDVYEVESFVHALMDEILDERATVTAIRRRLGGLLSMAANRSLNREVSVPGVVDVPSILREQAC